MIFFIFHVKQDAPHGTAFFEHPEPWAERKHLYDFVGHVEGRDLEDAFHSTQNLSIEWPENDNASAYRDPVRSTSVGDVILDEDGTPWEVGSVGFRNISKANPVGSVRPPVPLP